MYHPVVLAVLVLLFAAVPSSASVSGKSENCKQAVGEKQRDFNNAVAFCKDSVQKDLDVQGVMALDSLLRVQISRGLAQTMLHDRFTTERVVKNWMTAWKQRSGSRAVTVYVEWQDVEIAKGETTLFSGDQVTISDFSLPRGRASRQ